MAKTAAPKRGKNKDNARQQEEGQPAYAGKGRVR